MNAFVEQPLHQKGISALLTTNETCCRHPKLNCSLTQILTITMMRQPGSARANRRGSAIGLLNTEDDNAYGSNAQRYNGNKMKGSFVNRFKQNVEQKIEAVQDTLEEMPTKANRFSITTIKSSAKNIFASSTSDDTPGTTQGIDDWASMDDFNDSLEFGTNDAELDFDAKSFDFDNGFVQDDDDDDNGSVINPTNDSASSLNDSATPFIVTASTKDLGIKTRPEEGSKARAQRRSSCLGSSDGAAPIDNGAEEEGTHDNYVERLKNGEHDSILQFSPEPKEKQVAEAVKNELLTSAMDAVAATNAKTGTRDSFSASPAHQFDVPSHLGHETKGSRNGGVRRTKSATDGSTSRHSSRRKRYGRRPSADAEILTETALAAGNNDDSPKRRTSRVRRQNSNGRRASKNGSSKGDGSSSHHRSSSTTSSHHRRGSKGGDGSSSQHKTVARTSSHHRRSSSTKKETDELIKRAPKDPSLSKSYNGNRSTSVRKSSAAPTELSETSIKLVF